jgi:anti-sigma regulatory factor (Ser/Thr protein kinase)
MSIDHVSLTGPLRGESALVDLLAPSAQQPPDCELCINARAVDSIDVVGATATRMRTARHLREHPGGRVEIWQPGQGAVAARFYDILHPLPARAGMGERPETEPPTYFTLLPATAIEDSDAAHAIGELVWDQCLAARISELRAGYIALATMELTDNALIRATGALDPPVVAVSSTGRERIVEIAVTDGGTSISEAADPAAELAKLPGLGVDGADGFLTMIHRRAAAVELDLSMHVVAGTGRLRWTATQHRTESGIHVQGMTVMARVAAR